MAELRPPASREMIAAFEASSGTVLPSEIASYFAIVDGFEPGRSEQDARGFSFWSITRVCSVSQLAEGQYGFPGAENYFVFADYLSWSWAYAFRVLSASSAPIFIVGTANGVPHRVAPSFAQFVDIYIRNEPELYLTV